MAPSAGYREFFPNAPRAARDRANERERERYSKTSETPDHRQSTTTPLHLDAKHDLPSSDIAQPPSQNQDTSTEYQPGDLLNGVGSASSHASTASSIFSTRNNVAIVDGASDHNDITPLTVAGSPAHHNNTAQSSKERPSTAAMKSSATPPSVVQRLPARDPNRTIQGMKCVHDPSMDKSLSSLERKTMKPKYLPFDSVREPIPYYTILDMRGGRHLILYETLANKLLYRKMTPPLPTRAFPMVAGWTISMSIFISPRHDYARRHTISNHMLMMLLHPLALAHRRRLLLVALTL